MKHRVEIDISFDSEQDARNLIDFVEKIKKKAYKAKGDEKILPIRKCRYHSCSHDEENPGQCGGYENIDFDK